MRLGKLSWLQQFPATTSTSKELSNPSIDVGVQVYGKTGI